MKIMKVLFKWSMSEVLIMCMFFTGCVHSNDIKSGDPSWMQSVKVTILREPSTRSGIESQKHVGNDTAVLSNGYLYLTDSVGDILLYRKIDNRVNSTEGNVISLELLQNTGAIINDTPEKAVYCYVAMNLPSIGFDDAEMALSSGNISTVEKLAVNTGNLYDERDGINNVPLWGKGSLSQSSNPNYGFETTVNVNAIATRIEISKISGVPSKKMLDENGRPYEIVNFKIAGIFINNFFSRSQLSGLAALNSIVYYTREDKAYFSGTEDMPSTPYRQYTELFTYSPSGIAHSASDAANVYTPPQAGQAWAYNVFSNDTAGMNTTDYVPHIVVRFSQLTYRPQGSQGQGVTLNNQFITISGFLSNGIELQFLRKGWVYTFDNIPFSTDELSDLPEINRVKIDVQSYVIPWFREPIEPPAL